MKRLTNNLKHNAELLTLQSSIDSNDRPVQHWTHKRLIKYMVMGVTSTEKEQSKQSKEEVVRRMRIRRDLSITEKNCRIRIGGVDYKITRVFDAEDPKFMELSLAYVS
ncbi:phage head closure protein [Lactobacillus curvatus]|nr:phage head closure protein [Latilactobacillus curvatus]MSD84772.1 phage head closure protein [Latilactobacillus curvatus]MSE24635.1 phage head closure protein [Latilactobacillus curvatus]